MNDYTVTYRVDERLKHIAFIMDGNGRWATAQGKPREYGHKFGAEVFRTVSEYCADIGVRHITFYAFSTENWKRPKQEVGAIMTLFSDYLEEGIEKFREKDLRVVFLGDKAAFGDKVREKMCSLERLTEGGTVTLNIAINYGGRDELLHAFSELAAEGKTTITEEDVEAHLYTKNSPPPDLIVRTAGEMRLSNFLTWQSAYSELYFTDTLWPDFRPEDVDKAVKDFYRRKRRFGGV